MEGRGAKMVHLAQGKGNISKNKKLEKRIAITPTGSSNIEKIRSEPKSTSVKTNALQDESSMPRDLDDSSMDTMNTVILGSQVTSKVRDIMDSPAIINTTPCSETEIRTEIAPVNLSGAFIPTAKNLDIISDSDKENVPETMALMCNVVQNESLMPRDLHKGTSMDTTETDILGYQVTTEDRDISGNCTILGQSSFNDPEFKLINTMPFNEPETRMAMSPTILGSTLTVLADESDIISNSEEEVTTDSNIVTNVLQTDHMKEPSASTSRAQADCMKLRLKRLKKNVYAVQNSSTDSGDFSGTDSEDFRPSRSSSNSSSSSEHDRPRLQTSSTSTISGVGNTDLSSPPKKGKKRTRNPHSWKKQKAKLLRNSGKEYVGRTGKTVTERAMGPSCNCKLSCLFKFPQSLREEIFKLYWELGSLQRQRDFLASCISQCEVKYRRIKVNSEKEPRKPNCAFHFLKNGDKMKVCKTFLMNTLGITERTIRTVIEGKTSGAGIIPEDKRGKHNCHAKLDPEIMDSIRAHISSIPRVESHYLRANTKREFIDGGLSVAEMHRNYEGLRKAANKPVANYDAYFRVFNKDFNIGFFMPKKDQCDQCEVYKNATGVEKEQLKENYDRHQEEKELSRVEKKKEITNSKETGSTTIVAIYDLQAVLPVPLGKSSSFFYKSKLNCYNFTITNIKENKTTCYFWHEGVGNRGAIEIGTCVYDFLKEIAQNHPNSDVIFYSDNCCGQQKNRFLLSMYFYAVEILDIKSITHKFLIRGHTHNEGDNAHSVIETALTKAKQSGPIYVPDQYVSIIRCAKKNGAPFIVKELGYSDFIDLKSLCDEIGFNATKNTENDQIKLSELKVITFFKGRTEYSYKLSYKDESESRANIRLSGRRRATPNAKIQDICMKPAYTSKMTISERKKEDILQLIQTNIVPKYYETFYNSIFS